MGVGSWAAFAFAPLSGMLPGVLAPVINYPAFVVAAILSGNFHAPNDALFGVMSFLQWLLIGRVVANAGSHDAKPDDREQSE